MTERKNKRRKQVWPLFDTYVQNRQLIQLWEVCTFQTYTIPYACAASPFIAQPPIPLPIHSFSLQPLSTNRNPRPTPSPSPSDQPTNNQPKPTQLSSMASSSKHITFTGRSAQTTARGQQSEVHPGAQLAQLPGMGFGCIPLCRLFRCLSNF